MTSEPHDDNKNNVRRKKKFIPKAPPLRTPKVEVKREQEDIEDDKSTKAMDLFRRMTEDAMKAKLKRETRVNSSQIAFGYGGGSNARTSYCFAKSENKDQGGANSSSRDFEDDYRDPWDDDTNYPLDLPLRRPYSGNPEILNEIEFGDVSQTKSYDEKSRNAAEELGLMEYSDEPNFMFLQLPPTAPMIKRPAADINQTPDKSKLSDEAQATGFNALPAGFIGKLLVHKSGAVRLKIGDMIYKVNPGSECMFKQDIIALDSEKKECGKVGQVQRRAIVTPEFDSILEKMDDK